jgi:hypothetical protein
LFLDSNILTGGLIARWGLDKAVLSLCAARICQLVLAEAVRDEVEENLLFHAAELEEKESSAILDDYTGLIRLTAPEIVPYPDEADVIASRRLIAHEADVPVLLIILFELALWVGAVLALVYGVYWIRGYFLRASEPQRVTCPHCAELIQPAARICRYCQREVEEHLGRDRRPRGLFQ